MRPTPLAIAALLLLTACSRGPRNFENDNDRLRAENMELTEKVSVLTREVEDLRKALAASQAQARATKEPLPEGVTAPVLARVQFDRFSGGLDTNRDGNDDALRLYILTLDQRNRFVQVTARARITAIAAPPAGDPVTIAQLDLDPKALTDAYRSSTMGGTHYSVQFPLDNQPPAGSKQLLVQLTLHDLATGQTHTHEQLLPWTTK